MAEIRNSLTLVAIVLKALLLFSSLAHGQPIVRLKQNVQTCTLLACSRGEVSWSGCVIGTLSNGEQAVLTCAHAVKNRDDLQRAASVEIEPGVWVDGKWRGWHPDRDVGLIGVKYKAVPCYPLAKSDPAAGEEESSHGFAAGKPLLSSGSGRVTVITAEWFHVSQTFAQGESGGPILVDGCVAGVISGNTPRLRRQEGTGASVASIRKTLLELVRELPECGRTPVEPGPESVPTPLEPQPDPMPELRVILDRIEARLEALEKRPPQAGPAGPPGERGPKGDSVANGSDASVSGLEARLKKLEGLTIPLEIVRPDGTVERQGKPAKLGEPLRLYMTPGTKPKE